MKKASNGFFSFGAAHDYHAQPHALHDRVPAAFDTEHFGPFFVRMRLPGLGPGRFGEFPRVAQTAAFLRLGLGCEDSFGSGRA